MDTIESIYGKKLSEIQLVKMMHYSGEILKEDSLVYLIENDKVEILDFFNSVGVNLFTNMNSRIIMTLILKDMLYLCILPYSKNEIKQFSLKLREYIVDINEDFHHVDIGMEDILIHSVDKENVDLVRFLFILGLKLSSNLLDIAIENGDLDMIEYMIDIIPANEGHLRKSIKCGHLDIAKLIYKKVNIAILEVVEMKDLLTLSMDLNSTHMEYAVNNGYVNSVRFLYHFHGIPITKRLVMKAALAGQLGLSMEMSQLIMN